MTVGRLIEILLRADPSLRVGYEDEHGDTTDIEYVSLRNGKTVHMGNGYGNTETFWHPGNGNLGGDVKLIGHEWPQTK